MTQFQTVESILMLRDTSRYLYAGINANVVIVSPIDRETMEPTHWVFDESFDCMELWKVPMNYWASKNAEERYGGIFNSDIKPLWDWFNARKLMVAQVVFSYPDMPKF